MVHVISVAGLGRGDLEVVDVLQDGEDDAKEVFVTFQVYETVKIDTTSSSSDDKKSPPSIRSLLPQPVSPSEFLTLFRAGVFLYLLYGFCSVQFCVYICIYSALCSHDVKLSCSLFLLCIYCRTSNTWSSS